MRDCQCCSSGVHTPVDIESDDAVPQPRRRDVPEATNTNELTHSTTQYDFIECTHTAPRTAVGLYGRSTRTRDMLDGTRQQELWHQLNSALWTFGYLL